MSLDLTDSSLKAAVSKQIVRENAAIKVQALVRGVQTRTRFPIFVPGETSIPTYASDLLFTVVLINVFQLNTVQTPRIGNFFPIPP